MLQTHKTPQNLLVVDFESVAVQIFEVFRTNLQQLGLTVDSISEPDRKRLLQFCFYVVVDKVYASTKTNQVLLYIDTNSSSFLPEFEQSLTNLTRTFPIRVLKHNKPFKILSKQDTGEYVELVRLINSAHLAGFTTKGYKIKKQQEFCLKHGLTAENGRIFGQKIYYS